MTAVLQRVDRAACTVEGEVTGETGKGLLVLLGVAAGDTVADAAALAAKVARCRIFCDESGKMQRSVLDISGGALVISNFTLLADYAHGNRPSYFGAAARGRGTVPFFCGDVGAGGRAHGNRALWRGYAPFH